MSVQNPEMAEELRGLLGIEDISKVDDTTYVTVHVPEWKGSIRFGTLDAGTMLEHVKANEGPAKFTAGLRMIIESLVDANGKRIGNMQHLDMMKKRNAQVVNRLADDILKLNGFDKAPLDFTKKFVAAGEDPEKLAALVAEIHAFADSITAAGTDKEKLKAIADGKTMADTKNNSGGTLTNDSRSA